MDKDLSKNYSDSGVKTLRNISYVILIGGVISYVASICFGGSRVVDSIAYGSNVEFEFSLEIALTSLPILLVAIFFFGLGLCVSTITECNLINKKYIESQYNK